MARYRPPTTSSLRVFAAAARLLSFTQAANELSQTQSVISHQVRELEELLGVQLFDRLPRAIALSSAGERYLPFVMDALTQLRAGAEMITGKREETALTVSMSPNFAAKWLVPKLGLFSAAHPHLYVRISAAMEHVSFDQGDIDVASRHGNGDWPHLQVQRLCAETLFPACSPSFLDGREHNAGCNPQQIPSDAMAPEAPLTQICNCLTPRNCYTTAIAVHGNVGYVSLA